MGISRLSSSCLIVLNSHKAGCKLCFRCKSGTAPSRPHEGATEALICSRLGAMLSVTYLKLGVRQSAVTRRPPEMLSSFPPSASWLYLCPLPSLFSLIDYSSRPRTALSTGTTWRHASYRVSSFPSTATHSLASLQLERAAVPQSPREALLPPRGSLPELQATGRAVAQ